MALGGKEMIDYFDTPGSMSWTEVMDTIDGWDQEEQLDFLAELAAHVFKCPDKCDEWAVTTLNEMEQGWAEEQEERRFHDYHSG